LGLNYDAVTLSDISHGNGSYGIAASAVPYSDNLPTYLRITDINDDGTINFDGLKSVADPNASKYYLAQNDIVFARTGASTGRNYFYDGTDGEFVYAGFLIKFSIDPQKTNPLYVKYYCQSKDYYDWVASFSTGSTRGNINAQTLGNMPVPLPPRKQQDALAATLSALDARIANNTAINHHLEQMAQAIFKSWFVDFEPWGGMMPDEWREGTIGDICSYCSERIPVSALTVETYISTENMSANKGGFTSAAGLPTVAQTTAFIPGDTLISNIRPYFKKIVYGDFAGGCSTDVLCFRPHQANLSLFVFNALYDDRFFDFMVAGSKGTKMPRGDKQQIMDYRIAIPTDAVLDEFADTVVPISEKRLLLANESTRLAALRDTLLPRLMSGKLSV
jgi:type I restriction enzyme S subunit